MNGALLTRSATIRCSSATFQVARGITIPGLNDNLDPREKPASRSFDFASSDWGCDDCANERCSAYLRDIRNARVRIGITFPPRLGFDLYQLAFAIQGLRGWGRHLLWHERCHQLPVRGAIILKVCAALLHEGQLWRPQFSTLANPFPSRVKRLLARKNLRRFGELGISTTAAIWTHRNRRNAEIAIQWNLGSGQHLLPGQIVVACGLLSANRSTTTLPWAGAIRFAREKRNVLA
jgi:hypothetical protein